MTGPKTRQLLILRHAEAAPAAAGDDFDRPLTEKGRRDMVALAPLLAGNGLTPDRVFCSPARRTRETLQTILPACTRCDFPEALYNAPTGTMFEFAQTADDEHGTVMIVAHNPGVEMMVRLLCNADSVRETGFMGYPPGALAVIECDVESWADLQPQENTLRRFLVLGRDF